MSRTPPRAVIAPPVAIIATGCRFPGGVSTPDDLWRVLDERTDVIGSVPAQRGWDGPAPPGGFLDDIAGFDAALFRISPREALAMDPQQRLLLETAWQTIERAQIPVDSLRGSRTGVYVGALSQDYLPRLCELPQQVGTFGLTGSAMSVASGRIAYTFGLHGPALTVDTACSSSLVALHLAVGALRAGECDLALAAGVTVMSTPGIFTEFARTGGLAPDGRCHAFGDDADGTGWSEGVAVVALERLEDARRHGHPVLALVRGSAMTSDGASNGLTAPNGISQQKVIRAALADAGLGPADVDAVEAHGTGTRLGDPIEARALLATYGRDRHGGPPLRLGSVKSNLGHTQAAAGLAGVIKMVLALREGLLPATLHVERPTRRVNWAAGSVSLLTEAVTWTRGDRIRRAAVSAFGISGTNAHVILEEAPPAPSGEAVTVAIGGPVPSAPERPRMLPWVLTAAGEQALTAQAALLATALEAGLPGRVADLGLSLATTRALQAHRAVLLAPDRAGFGRLLSALASGAPDPGLVQGVATTPGSAVFVFPGQGAQWLGMGRELYRDSAVFAARMDECEQLMAAEGGFSLTAALADPAAFERVDRLQPMLFAVMVSLAEVWRHAGVLAVAVVGHSQGEIAAAVVAGALSLADGVTVVCRRARLLAGLAGQGGMLSVARSQDEVRADLSRWNHRLELGVVNGPSSVVLTGEPAALEAARAYYEERGVRARAIPVNYASHCAQVEAIEAPLRAELAAITPRPAAVPFYSTVLGAELDGAALDAGYWYRNLRQTVYFDRAVAALLDTGHGPFVEISPHPVLVGSIAEAIEEQGAATIALGSLRRDAGDGAQLTAALAAAFASGLDVNWELAFAGIEARRVALPTYAFQRQRYWLDPQPDRLPAPTPAAATETWFWDAVRRADLPALRERLALDGAQTQALHRVLPVLQTWSRRGAAAGVTDSWRYRVGWTSLVRPQPATVAGSWLVVTGPEPAGPTQLALLAGLRRRGAEVHTFVVPDGIDRARLGRDLHGLLASDGNGGVVRFDRLLSLVALGSGGSGDRAAPASPVDLSPLLRTVLTVQALGDAGGDRPLWCLTQGAVSIGAGDRLDCPSAAMVWGLGPVVGLERPAQWGGLIDLPPTLTGPDIDVLIDLLAGSPGPGEDQIALRAGGVHGRRLHPAPIGDQVPTRTWRPTGTTLITGGTGALGAQLARRLAAAGAPHLLLLSRSGPQASGADQLVTDLRSAGSRVSVVAGDAGDRDVLGQVLADLPDGLPLTAVFHTAAILLDGTVDALDPERVETVLRAKAVAAAHLDDLTRGLDLSAFVLFSSVAGTLGVSGQGNYAPGNAYLDALAQRRRAEGRPATSIAWGAWAGAGMGAGTQTELLRRHGVPAMVASAALDALGTILDYDETTVMVAQIDWDRFRVALTASRPSRLISEIPGAGELDPGPAPESVAAAVRSGLRAVMAAPADRRRRVLLDLVREHTATVLGHSSSDQVEDRNTFRDLGMDSVTGVELRNRLSAVTGIVLPVGLIYDCPTPEAVTERLLPELAAPPATADPVGPTAVDPAGGAARPEAPGPPSPPVAGLDDDELLARLGLKYGLG